MDIIFMNSKNSKNSAAHKLILNLKDKINFKKNDKYVPLSNFIICYLWKKIKKPYKNK